MEDQVMTTAAYDNTTVKQETFLTVSVLLCREHFLVCETEGKQGL